MPSNRSNDDESDAKGFGEELTVELLQRARSGDTLAWESLDHRHRDALMTVAHGSMKGAMRQRLDSEDLVQSTFVAAFAGLDSFEYRGPGSLQAWLRQILLHRINQKFRHHLSDKRDVRRHADAVTLESQLDFSTMSPGDALLAAEEQAQYIDALDGLPALERRVVVALKIEGVPVGALATELGVDVSTIRRHRARAVAMMTKRVD